MTWLIILMLAGLIVLIAGGEFLVRGASAIALRARLSPLVVGLTIVAFGTSAPELLISLQAALSGSPDLVMGNVVGSNICNLALILGITALIFPIRVANDSIRIDWPVTMGSSLLLYFMVRERLLSAYEGLLFIVVLVIYLFFIIRRSRRSNYQDPLTKTQETKASPKIWLRDILFLIAGGAGLFFGADWFVSGARQLAIDLGVAERVVGITVLALGTSLPELVTSAVAAFRKNTDIALGNLMGSNIFNILSILGITSMVQEIVVSDMIFKTDMVWMLAITLLILPMMWIRRKITRLEGFILLSLYCFYTFTVIY